MNVLEEDICLIWLTKSIRYSINIGSILLPTRQYFNGTELIVLGNGRTESTIASFDLRKAKVII